MQIYLTNQPKYSQDILLNAYAINDLENIKHQQYNQSILIFIFIDNINLLNCVNCEGVCLLPCNCLVLLVLVEIKVVFEKMMEFVIFLFYYVFMLIFIEEFVGNMGSINLWNKMFHNDNQY